MVSCPRESAPSSILICSAVLQDSPVYPTHVDRHKKHISLSTALNRLCAMRMRWGLSINIHFHKSFAPGWKPLFPQILLTISFSFFFRLTLRTVTFGPLLSSSVFVFFNFYFLVPCGWLSCIRAHAKIIAHHIVSYSNKFVSRRTRKSTLSCCLHKTAFQYI